MSDATKAVKEEQKAKSDLEKAAEKAAPTGADVPEATREPVEGEQTAHNPDQPKPGQKNSLAQTEPALRTRGGKGGTVPHAHVSSPAGMIPAPDAAALAKYTESLQESIRPSVEDDFEELDEAALMSMSKPEMRALAMDRGYRIGEGGKRTLARNFLSEQRKAKKEKK